MLVQAKVARLRESELTRSACELRESRRGPEHAHDGATSAFDHHHIPTWPSTRPCVDFESDALERVGRPARAYQERRQRNSARIESEPDRPRERAQRKGTKAEEACAPMKAKQRRQRRHHHPHQKPAPKQRVRPADLHPRHARGHGFDSKSSQATSHAPSRAPTPVPMKTGQAGGTIKQPRLIVALLNNAVTPCDDTQSLTHS
jgi:hypothetical protein